MKAERLIELFERVGEAPGAVERLRKLVLELAMRGSLSPEGESAKWSKLRLSDCAAVLNGRAYKKQELLSAGTPVVRIQNLNGGNSWYYSTLDLEDAKYCQSGDLLFAWSGTFGPYIWQGPRSIYHYHIWKLVPNGNSDTRFLFHLLRHLTEAIKAEAHGLMLPHMTKERMENWPVLLPPMAEQQRIVARVDELMALCDRLQSAQAERERRRDQLVSASLQRLREPVLDGALFREQAAFHLRHMGRMTTRGEHVREMREAVLAMAVRGMLAPQVATDEPIQKTLARTDKPPRPARYESRSRETVPGVCGLSIGHPGTRLPNDWAWVPMIEVARLESGHTPSRSRSDWWGGDIPWIGLVDAREHDGGVIRETIQYTNEKGIANSAARVLPAGTVCFSRTASVGYVVIMGRPMATSQDFVNWVPTKAVTSEWLQLVLRAERSAMGRFSKGAIHQTVYFPAWLSMHIALPPVAQQVRIVEAVRALLSDCANLERTVGDVATYRTRLTEAAIAGLLSGA